MHYSMLSAMLALSLTGSLIAQSKAEAGKGSQPKTTTTASADGESRLPVKRVVLYKNGVAYFEHAARVHGTADLSIDFTTSQLNDVLKSGRWMEVGSKQR